METTLPLGVNFQVPSTRRDGSHQWAPSVASRTWRSNFRLDVALTATRGYDLEHGTVTATCAVASAASAGAHQRMRLARDRG
jgi:hypothetical protein